MFKQREWLDYSIVAKAHFHPRFLKWVLTRGGQLIPDGRIIWLWGPRSGPSRGGGAWPSGAIIFLGGAAMELACISAILDRTASQPSNPACKEKKQRGTLKTDRKKTSNLKWSESFDTDTANASIVINDSILSDTRFLVICNDFGVLKKQTHFIWSRTELLGRCDIAVVYVSAGTGVGTRSSRDPSIRMVRLVGSHTHLTHLALKLRKRRMWMKQTKIKLQHHLLSGIFAHPYWITFDHNYI